MKRVLAGICCLLPVIYCWGQETILPVIPHPNTVRVQKGHFTLSSHVSFYDKGNKFPNEIIFFNRYLEKNFGFTLQVTQDSTQKNIIRLEPAAGKKYLSEAYSLQIKPDGIDIYGDSAGIFYSFQTLIQLINDQPASPVKIPCGSVFDYPRYPWRGMHLDVCRHFFTKEEVKKYIDYLALYKFNVFHWHLCDDQGWRIEIKKYPLLTQVGAIRKETVIGKPSDTAKYDGKPYGGFYTQEDIKEIVAYASARCITIVPEIEMPGHSLAALSAYPQFSCAGGSFSPATSWGVFDDVYCAGNDSTFIFLENILSEVSELFPGKYIHIGGDECPKTRWEKCSKCQQRIKNEKLKDEHELQSYFIQRIEKFLNSKGKQVIGWDEILEGGLAPNAAVMSWRGTEGGIAAAKLHHFVVMTPGKPCYFDHYQSKNKSKEPLAIGGFNPLENVYAYDPAPKELTRSEQQYIMGAQGNVWTEYIPDFSRVEYMSLPRMCALAEALWTKPENKNYANFIARLKLHRALLDKMKVNYARHFLKEK